MPSRWAKWDWSAAATRSATGGDVRFKRTDTSLLCVVLNVEMHLCIHLP